jgi:hypothetical protein
MRIMSIHSEAHMALWLRSIDEMHFYMSLFSCLLNRWLFCQRRLELRWTRGTNYQGIFMRIRQLAMPFWRLQSRAAISRHVVGWALRRGYNGAACINLCALGFWTSDVTMECCRLSQFCVLHNYRECIPVYPVCGKFWYWMYVNFCWSNWVYYTCILLCYELVGCFLSVGGMGQHMFL